MAYARHDSKCVDKIRSTSKERERLLRIFRKLFCIHSTPRFLHRPNGSWSVAYTHPSYPPRTQQIRIAHSCILSKFTTLFFCCMRLLLNAAVCMETASAHVKSYHKYSHSCAALSSRARSHQPLDSLLGIGVNRYLACLKSGVPC